MKKILKLYLLISANFLFSQVKPFSAVEIKSPQTYSFEKQGNIPVSLYTGAIDLKIPIASIPLGNGKNIEGVLSYDSSGFIPHKKSELAGINWSLILGGRITRSLNRIADEYIGSPTSSGGNPFDSGLNLHGFLTGVRMNPYSNSQAYDLNSGVGSVSGQNWILGPSAQGYEGEPDLFRFSIMGLSGEFMIGNDGKVVVKSNDPDLKVDISSFLTSATKAVCFPPDSQIILTDGDGNKYYFGGDFSKFEISYSRSSPGMSKGGYSGYPYISSFSISKIVLSNNREITFNYKQGTLLEDFCHMMNVPGNLESNAMLLDLESYYQDGAMVNDVQNCPNGPNFCYSASTSSPSTNKSYSLLKKSLLESVVFEDYKIAVNYKDAGYPIKHDDSDYSMYFNEFVLDNVSTYFKTELIKKTSFEYQNLGGVNPRPFLSKITELDPSKFYSLEYYDTNSLPKYDTKGIDHWGYWNGLDSNTFLAPFDTYNSTTGDYTLNNTFRDASITKTNVGLLKKIIYPTKGYTVFEYEPQYYGKRIERNSASAFLPTLTNNSGLCGGARIKRQYDFSGSGTIENEKEYKYTTDLNNGLSSGILMNWPRYIYYFEFIGSGYVEKYFIKSSSNVQQNSLDGYNVGYSKVFEIIKNNGYIEHDFTSYETFPDKLSPDTQNLRQYITIYPSYPENLYKNFKNLYGNDKSVLRGRQLLERVYANNGTLLKKTEYSYHDMINYNPNTSQDENNYVSIQHLSGVWVQGYKKYFNDFSLKSKIITDFLTNGQTVSQSEYFYESANHLKTSREKTTATIGDVLETKYYYPQDTQMASKPFVTNLKNSNILGKPLVTQTYNNGAKLSENETVYGLDTTTNNLLLPKEILSNLFPNPINGLEKKYTFNQYDSKGNIAQYTQENGIPVTVIWGYKQTLPIAKIENATYAQVQQYEANLQTLSNGTDENALITALSSLRSNFPNAMVTTYTHKPLIGISTITDPKGDVVYYSYDSSSRLINIKDKNLKIISENKYHYKN